MAVRTYIPIDKTFDGRQKNDAEALQRLQRERYSNPIYEIGQITDFVYSTDDPLEITDLERKIIVQPYSFDKSLDTAIKPEGDDNSFDDGHEEVTSYIIGVRKNHELSTIIKIGDIIEIEIVNNEITKRNGIDGFYSSTLQESIGVWRIIEGNLYNAIDLAKRTYNGLSKNFNPGSDSDVLELTQEILQTKKTAPAYKGGRRISDIEIVTIEGKEVEINTAKKYLEMKKAAREEGVYLSITSGYRSMESQIQIYNNRYEPDYQGSGNCGNKGENISGVFQTAAKVSSKGVAAYPGCSNHQNGKALDISNSPRNVSWLKRNGSRFGFYNTVRSENWHWEYIG